MESTIFEHDNMHWVEMDSCLCLCLAWPSVCMFVCVYVLGEEMSWRLCLRGQTHSKAPQSSVLNMRVSPLHVACRQWSVSRLTPAVSTAVMFPSRKTRCPLRQHCLRSVFIFWKIVWFAAAQWTLISSVVDD